MSALRLMASFTRCRSKQGGFVAAGELLLQVADLRKVLVRALSMSPIWAR
jgi:hypothetical protein